MKITDIKATIGNIEKKMKIKYYIQLKID